MTGGGEGEIDFSALGIAVGHATDEEGATGCTVVRGVSGPMRGAAAVIGRATGTRDLLPLTMHHLVDRIDAILLTGGSAYGMDAAAGVMRRYNAAAAAWATARRSVRASGADNATTASVVFVVCSASNDGGAPPASSVTESRNPFSPRAPAMIWPSAPRTSPSALTTAIAPTTSPAPSATAQPKPPFIAHSLPAALPTVAPVPAPTLPFRMSWLLAFSHASYAISGVGRALKAPNG